MYRSVDPLASTRQRARRRMMALAIAIFLTGCSGGSSGAGDPGGRDGDPSDRSAEPDRAAQPLEAVALSAMAPIDGRDAGVMLEVARWVGDHRRTSCGGPGTFVGEDDRFDQVLFPDLDLIVREGLGLARSAAEPPADVEPADENCLATVLPEMAEAEKVFGEWMEVVVHPTWSEGEVVASADESAACLRDEMGWDDGQGEDLDSFLANLDGVITGWSDLAADDRASRVADLDRRASAALETCASDTYDLFTDRLREQRTGFLDRHHETVSAVADALDEAGYAP